MFNEDIEHTRIRHYQSTVTFEVKIVSVQSFLLFLNKNFVIPASALLPCFFTLKIC